MKQCFHNRLFKNPFTISKIPFSPQNFLVTQTVGKIKKIQANLRQMYHRLYEKSSIITLPENLGKLSRVPSINVSAPHICLCLFRGVRCLIDIKWWRGWMAEGAERQILKFIGPRSPEMAFSDSSVSLLLDLYYL